MYNGERHLRPAIESVLGQTFGDIALVISDNASTDATGEICKEYAEADDRVFYKRLPTNLGARANFHSVFARARSEYFKWAGHDDLLAPTFVERCVSHLDAHQATVLCTSRLEIIDGDNRRLGDGPPPIAFTAPTPHQRLRAFFNAHKTHQTIFGVLRRDVLARTRLLGPWFSSDRALLLELSLHGDFGLLDDTLFVHREHPGRGDYVQDKIDWYTRAQRPSRGRRLALPVGHEPHPHRDAHAAGRAGSVPGRARPPRPGQGHRLGAEPGPRGTGHGHQPDPPPRLTGRPPVVHPGFGGIAARGELASPLFSLEEEVGQNRNEDLELYVVALTVEDQQL